MKNKQNKAIQRGNFSFKLTGKLKTTSINNFNLARAMPFLIILLLSISIVSAADVVVKAGDFDIGNNLNVTGNASILGTSLTVNAKEVCLNDGTNCQATVGTSVDSSEIENNTIVDDDISDSTDLTLSQKITFALGAIIDNIVDGWITITGNLNVSGNIETSKNITAGYFIGDGSYLTNLSAAGNSSWNESYANTKYGSNTTWTAPLFLENNVAYIKRNVPYIWGRALMDTGKYTGTGAEQAISSGCYPAWIISKKNNSATAAYTRIYRVGSKSLHATAAALADSEIIRLNFQTKQFSVGTGTNTNSAGSTNFKLNFGIDFNNDESSSYYAQWADGWYSGNGGTKSISGLGFTPKFVMIKGSAASSGVWKSDQHSGTVTSYWTATADDPVGMITSLDADGFTVGADAQVNSNGYGYYWVAAGNAANATSLMAIGEYSFEANTGETFIETPFQPDIIYTFPESALHPMLSTTQGTTLYLSAATASVTDAIYTWSNVYPYGFWLVTNANIRAANTKFVWVAIKE